MKWFSICLILLASVGLAEAQHYRSCDSCYVQPSYQGTNYHQSYYQPTYIKEYIPYAIRVQVDLDRYYSLSDLYRDRMYRELYELMMADKYKNEKRGQGAAARTETPPEPRAGQSKRPATVEAPSGRLLAKTSPRVVAILNKRCAECHPAGNAKFDVSDPDKIGMGGRWMAYGMVTAGDMPKVPNDVREAGEAEINKWKKEHACKDDEVQAIYDDWLAPNLVRKAAK